VLLGSPGEFTLENYPCDEDGHDCDGQHIERGKPGSWVPRGNVTSRVTYNASELFTVAENGFGVDAARNRRSGGKSWEWEKWLVGTEGDRDSSAAVE